MASSFSVKRTGMMKSVVNAFQASRSYAVVAVGTDLISAAPDISLQKARSWDEGVSSKFAITTLKDFLKHVPSYNNNIDKFKAKGVDSVICVAVNDPYTLNGWAEKLQAKDDVVCVCC